MTALVTKHLPLVAGAPDGIKKLRLLILDLATCGRLVAQKCTSSGLITGNSHGWRVKPVGEIAECLDRLRRPITKQNRVPGPIPYYGASGVVDFVDDYIFDEPLVLVGEDGAKWGAGEATSFSISGKAWVNNHAHVLRPDESQILGRFLVLSLVAKDLTPYITGMTVPKLNQARLNSIPISVPTIEEQHRIVAKVDELMTLCDRLEADQADAEAAHAQLVQALLDSLTQATDAADFRASWQRLSEHFHTLFTTEASIDALKQTVLQLAVMGRLVPQSPSDESASVLMKRIQAEGKVARNADIEVAPLEDEGGRPMALPAGWLWVPFGSICSVQSNLVRPEDFMDSQQLAPDCIEKGTGRIIERRTVRQSGVRGPNCRFFSGQIVYSKIRPSLSKAVLVDFDGLCSADMYPINSYISPSYQLRLMLSEVFLRQVRLAENRVKMPKLNQESLNSFVVPIPPLPEQHRIVAKVDELMDLCDQLKTQLAEACQQHAQLASVLVEQAVGAS